MAKKLVLQISPTNNIGTVTPLCNDSSASCDITTSKINNIIDANKVLLSIVTFYKDKITEHYQSKQWDRYKKLSNEYELIFYSSNSSCNISTITPVSRSFFKLWEILHDFSVELGVNNKNPMKCVFLAEGPGGFYEAFHRYRHGIDDDCYGITLKSHTKTIPDWKTNKRLPIKIHYGKDGTGNLYNITNINAFVEDVGEGTIDFITADGGFDFSSDFNHQEEQSVRLIVSEITTALMLQKEGGCFLLKIYDCFNEETLRILHVLYDHYQHIYMIKPLTSRPANSERYMLCTGFHRGTTSGKQQYLRNLQTLMKLVEDYDHTDVYSHLQTIPFNTCFLNNIVMYNVYYTMRQILYIQRTIHYITFFGKSTKDRSDVETAIIQKHKDKSVKWCIKYGIPFKSSTSPT